MGIEFRFPKMWVFESLLIIVLVNYICGLQNQYTVFQENLTLPEVDSKVVDITAGVFPLNEATNGVNFTFKFHIKLPSDSKISATAFKWLKGDYKLGLVNVYKTIPSAIQMEMFDLQSLFVECCRPPVVWPVRKEVLYRCVGWTPDSTKFPPHLPGGRWKVPISIMFANNTKMAVATWYLKLSYKKQ